MRSAETSRRRFLQAAGSALAVPFVVARSAAAAPASDRIVMATIGCGGQGTGDMQGFLGFPQVQMVAVCDVVTAHRDRARDIVNSHYKNQDCKTYGDFREVLARPDIDAVLIGTPDHWHALITIAACQHGKDVYCEKPECLTIREGRAMANAVERYGRVFSGGSQRVLGDYGDWPRLVRGGALGEIKEVFADCWGSSGDCYLEPQTTPPGVDWEMWLGPAPWRPFHDSLINGGFRPYRDFSGGGMTDWGAHRFGAAMFATGVHKTGPVEIIPPDGGEHKLLTYVFANGMKMYHGGTSDITYKGTEGELPGKHRTPTARVDMEGYRGDGGIFGDFLHCVKTRELPFRNIEVAHRATTVCHLGNIAYWLKRPLKWDPKTETIVGDPEANRWLDRPKRALVALSVEHRGTLSYHTHRDLSMTSRQWMMTLAACLLGTVASRGDEPSLKQTFEKLLPGIGAASGFEQPQQAWQVLCWNAGAPGHEADRLEACKLMAAKLGPETPARARIWLLKELERIGRAESVDAVAAILNDPDNLVRDAALRALTNIPVPAAGAKLREALKAATDDTLRVALINGLGYQREMASSEVLESLLLSNADNPPVAIAAARSLGKIPNIRAFVTLRRAFNTASGETRLQIGDALARQAQSVLAAGDRRGLSPSTGDLLSRPSEPSRLAGLQLRLRTAQDRVSTTILDVLAKADSAESSVALGHVAQLNADQIRKLADGLSSLPPAAQIRLLRALGPRRERAALRTVVAATDSSDPAVKTAALAALGGVGDASTVPVLVKAIQDGGDAANVARQSLESVFADGVDDALVGIMKSTTDKGRRAQFIEILDHRRAASAVPALLVEAGSNDDNVRRRAISALGNIAAASDVAAMIAALLKNTDAGERGEAARAIALVCSRGAGDEQAEPVLAVYNASASNEQVILLPVLGRIGGTKALTVVREAVASPEAARRATAIEALHNWPDASVADDLARLVESTADRDQKHRLIQSLVRVVTLQGGRSNAEKLALLTRAMKQADRDEERRLILDRAREVPSFATVTFIAPYLDDPKTAGLACATIVEILHHDEIRNPHRTESDAVLDKVIAIARDRSLKERARSFKSKP